MYDRLLGRLAAYLREQDETIPRTLPARERFSRLVGAYWEFCWTDPAYARVELWTLAECASPQLPALAEGKEAIQRLTNDVVGDMIMAGILRADTSPDLFAATLVTLSLGQYGLLGTGASEWPVCDASDPATRRRLHAIVEDALLGAFGSEPAGGIGA
jgi:hypothetical protein